MSKRIILGTVLSTVTVFILALVLLAKRGGSHSRAIRRIVGFGFQDREFVSDLGCPCPQKFRQFVLRRDCFKTGNSSRLKGKYTNQELVRNYGRLTITPRRSIFVLKFEKFVSLGS